MKHIVEQALELLQKKESFVLATIVSQEGSAPRSAGAHMLIQEDGCICGTIGGGILEALVQQTAGDVFATKEAVLKTYVLDGKDLDSIDMTCGGQVDVLVDYIDAADENYLAIYSEMNEAVRSGQRVWLVTRVPGESDDKKAAKQTLIKADGSVIGLAGFDPQLIKQFAARTNKYNVFTISEKYRMVIETVGSDGVAYLMGAGHVGQKLAPMLSLVGFQVVVMDDRAEFASSQRFPDANRIEVLDNFDHVFHDFAVDRDSYIIIVTRGHLHDKKVLEQALKTGAGYIGMIGSRKKRDAIYQSLLEQGYTHMDIERVYCPIGLPIKAESPEEIAVSITAELIKVRAELK